MPPSIQKTPEESDKIFSDVFSDTETQRAPAGRRDIKLLVATFVICTVVILGAIGGTGYMFWKKNQQDLGQIRTQVEAVTAKANEFDTMLQPQEPEPEFIDAVIPEDAPSLGPIDAKVTVIEYADFQCPFCGKFFTDVLPQLKANYIDTGKIRFVFHDLAFLGDESTWAAEAAKCAGDQDAFWEYHDYLYSHQDGENDGAFAIANLKKFAKTLKLDTATFNDCLDTHKHAAAVQADTQQGQADTVSSTPTLIINRKKVVGARPYADFAKEIDAALNQ